MTRVLIEALHGSRSQSERQQILAARRIDHRKTFVNANAGLVGLRTAAGNITLGTRVCAFALVLFLEKILLNVFVDFDAAQTAVGLGAIVRDAQHLGFRFLVAGTVCLALLGCTRFDGALIELSTAARGVPLRGRWLLLHALLVALLAMLSHNLYAPGEVPFAIRVAVWLTCALGAAVTLGVGLAPAYLWRRLAQALGVLWLYAAAAAAVAACAMPLSQNLWQRASHVTFTLVGALLGPFVPGFHADPAIQVLTAGDFAVQISEVCSGLEGAGLMLAFCCVWLLYFRKDYYFPRAFILLPLGLLLVLALNVLRIAVLVLIGYAGLPAVAVYGFHSQAGWIAFNGAAAAMALASQRSRWLSRAAADPQARTAANPATPYLLPLLGILAAGMLTVAVSSGFDTLYPVRLFAGATALLYCLPRLTALDWRISWRGPLVGLAVFALWVAAARVLTAPAAMPKSLAAMAPAVRGAWIVARSAAAVVTVPLAEELAYHGYLMRRLMAAEFENVRFGAVRPWAILLTAVAFGVLHGTMWPAGIAAGVIYGFVTVRTGRIGEAVAAHAVTNTLVCAWVMTGERWQLW